MCLCTDAKTGGAAGAAAVAKGKHKMATDEALKILNLDGIKSLDLKALETVCVSSVQLLTIVKDPRSTFPHLLFRLTQQQYMKFFEANDPQKGGSFYLQSKIFRAKEAIESDLKAAASPPPPGSDDVNQGPPDSSSTSKTSSDDKGRRNR